MEMFSMVLALIINEWEPVDKDHIDTHHAQMQGDIFQKFLEYRTNR